MVNVGAKKISIDVFFIKVLIFLMFFAPATLQIVKVVVVALIIPFSFNKKRALNAGVIFSVFCYFLIHLYFTIKGIVNGGEVVELIPVTLLYPFVIFFVILLHPDFYKINFDRLFSFIAVCIAIYALFFLLAFRLKLIQNMDVPIMGTRINNFGGSVNYFSQNITSLFFLVPFVIAMPTQKGMGLQKLVTLVVLLLAVAFIGRRALTLLTVVSFLPVLVKKSKHKVAVGMLILSVIIVLLVFANQILSAASSAFSLDPNKFGSLDALLDTTGARDEQINALLEGLRGNHFLGAGLGINAEGSVRSNLVGNYEMSYVAMLFKMGVVGFALIMFFYLYSLSSLVNSNFKYAFPMLIGLCAVLIANYSNPYLGNFDYCWLILLPLPLRRFKAKFQSSKKIAELSGGKA